MQSELDRLATIKSSAAATKTSKQDQIVSFAPGDFSVNELTKAEQVKR